MTTLPFAKYHGAGNDFVLADGRDSDIDFARTAAFLADRRFGVGCDQVLVLRKSETAETRMEIFNSDGSRAEMCGNGIRAFVAWCWSIGVGSAPAMSVETDAGVMQVDQRPDQLLTVNMGQPGFTWADIAADSPAVEPGDPAVVAAPADWPVPAGLIGYGISMGNPHLAIAIDQLGQVDLAVAGPVIEHDDMFPDRINVEFFQVTGAGSIAVKVWERGAGATLACGTGACAAAVAAIHTGQVTSPVQVHMPGGMLEVAWQSGDPVFLTGPAVAVATGQVNLDAQASRRRDLGI